MDFFRSIDWSAMLEHGAVTTGGRIVLIVTVTWFIFRLSSFVVARALGRRLSPQAAMLARKGLMYTGAAVAVFLALAELGFDLTALLGAAGIAGIAIAFASQTSVSNVISGLFLVSEKPFEVGDVVVIDGTTGIVESIDLLSVKMRTFDNRFVRIPNEMALKNQLVNVTRYPIRRFDLEIGVAYKEDVDRVRRILLDIAKRNPFCLDEPEPIFIFREFGDSALEILFGLWFSKTDMLKLRNSIMPEIKSRFDAEGIEIPFPHRTLYAGSATEPFPVRVADTPLAPDKGGG